MNQIEVYNEIKPANASVLFSYLEHLPLEDERGYIFTKDSDDFLKISQTHKSDFKNFLDCLEIIPFSFNTIMVLKNSILKPSKDDPSLPPKLMLSVGDYTGSKLIIENEEIEERNTPIIFDGKLFYHYQTPIKTGTKYTLIFYDIKK